LRANWPTLFNCAFRHRSTTEDSLDFIVIRGAARPDGRQVIFHDLACLFDGSWFSRDGKNPAATDGIHAIKSAQKMEIAIEASKECSLFIETSKRYRAFSHAY
jgi:hypothetical protein